MPETLSYSSIRSPAEAKHWLATRLAVVPAWGLALILMLPVLGFHYYGDRRLTLFPFAAAFFVVGALRRLSWIHILIMLALALGWFASEAMIRRWVSRIPFPYGLAVRDTLPVLAVGLVEWILSRNRRAKSLLWIVVLAIGTGCLIELVSKPLHYSALYMPLLNPGLPMIYAHLDDIAYWLLLAALTWVVVPAGLKLGQPEARGGRIAATAFSLASAGGFWIFFSVLIYPIACQSLLGNGPFDRMWAGLILETRGNDADRQALWQAIEKADWSKPEYPDNRDYRPSYIEEYARRNPQAAAEHLSELLREKPSRALAAFSAQLFADQKCYETVPLLMRYSLQGCDQCTNALEAMKIPETALSVIMESSQYDRPAPLTADFPISDQRHARLTRLLGKDVGPNLHDWTSYYDSIADHLPTPLNAEQAEDTSRVVDAMLRFSKAKGRLYKAKSQLFVRRVRESGNGKFINDITGQESILKGQRHLIEADMTPSELDPLTELKIEGIQTKAFAEMAVAEPNCCVKETDGLEREVQMYAGRVRAMISKYQPATTLQTTTPTTLPSAN